MFVVGLAPRRKRKQTSGIMLDRLTKSRGGRMEIHFEVGLKRPRDATESAKLVSEAAVAVRCHVLYVSSQHGFSTGMTKTKPSSTPSSTIYL